MSISSSILPDKIKVILATDCGSTTSKARLFKKIRNEYRFVASGEAPTTVEAPFEDVTLGVINAIREIEDLTQYKILNKNSIIMPSEGDKGVDLYVTTSSAGGGLQMVVAGVVKSMTAESAERAALGAGAIVMDVMAIDDGLEDYEKVQRIRHLRPDIILLCGGTDKGTIFHVVKMAELIRTSNPKPRLGSSYKLPIIYGGNVNAREHIQRIFKNEFILKIVDNIRPVLEIENVEPTRDAIHEFFMEHVMSHAPGYDKLMKWTPIPIMPTPAAEGKMMQLIAKTYNANVLGVGLGGATTNVYSVYEGKFTRTVSANLGMSYSICNVLKETGIRNIMRWLPFDVEEHSVLDKLRNKMIRPTTIPQTLHDLIIEHAVAREALRLGFEHHKTLARPLRGARMQRPSIFEQHLLTETYIDMLKINWIVGTGGLLSHAPRRAQSALILIDAFQPEGVTRIAQDSVFMMPHLGVLSTVHPKAAIEIFEKDCLVHLGTCIAPRGQILEGERRSILELIIEMPDGKIIKKEIISGSIQRIQLDANEKAKVKIKPARGFNVGAGSGAELETVVHGGVVGLIIDCRGRPIVLPKDENERRRKLIEWFKAMDAYPNL
jgi:uncharacterized protein (TIGR01319 family)